MSKLSFLKKLFVGSVITASMLTGANAATESKYVIATASTGGTFYPVGVGIATIASLKLAKQHKTTFSAITSAGSAENVDMLEKGEVNFAIIQGLFGSMAWQGKAKYDGDAKKNLRSISMLWQNVEQFTIRKDFVKTGNAMDLKNLYGESFSIGGRSSGSRVSSEIIMESLGIDYNKMNIQYLGYTPSSTALQDGKIDGMNTPSGPPTSAVTNAFASIGNDKIKVLDFTSEQLAKITENYPVWTPFNIKAGTYPGQDKDINTIAQPNLLVVTKDTPEETVYLLTKTIYENLPFLNTVHKATKAMSLDKAISGLPMPLHPGAARFYKEQGINIPANLIAK
ncbi:C4-dicarboxylate ABC transporter substrate-binding protein [Malaciobacter pacificus]|uniref:TRAP transporter, substrate binding protein, TAXI family n=1 Tax=Malaciobacter pacificus TaxID=1080223 RepID=A0A5C2H9Y2_9BACT|nr:TAXI family TRAP transporter solute-binding subunit [Malaciobacter pacificus]QEP34026.1 TRAP transporter, substrate binding protein, TAXI family [Malaciobacter pacificus]GGD35943.1 C4-dicarboxylate ABC transporter substrate-binding protein [Malaciobacter pacificus]